MENADKEFAEKEGESKDPFGTSQDEHSGDDREAEMAPIVQRRGEEGSAREEGELDSGQEEGTEKRVSLKEGVVGDEEKVMEEGERWVVRVDVERGARVEVREGWGGDDGAEREGEGEVGVEGEGKRQEEREGEGEERWVDGERGLRTEGWEDHRTERGEEGEGERRKEREWEGEEGGLRAGEREGWEDHETESEEESEGERWKDEGGRDEEGGERWAVRVDGDRERGDHGTEEGGRWEEEGEEGGGGGYEAEGEDEMEDWDEGLSGEEERDGADTSRDILFCMRDKQSRAELSQVRKHPLM